MTQAKRISARAVLLAAGTAGFVALGAGIAGAEGLDSPVREITPLVERALVEGVAPTVNSLAPGGVGPIAGTALSELQDSAHNPDRPAPDLSAPLPRGTDVATPVGTVPNPVPALADTVSGAQDATGLDGNPHDTVGHTAGAVVEERAVAAGGVLEDTARGVGSEAEATLVEVVPHTVEATYALRDRIELPGTRELTTLPQAAELPDPSDLTALTGNGSIVLDEVVAPLGRGTVRQSAPVEPLAGLTDTVFSAPEGTTVLGLGGPLADAGVPRITGTGIAPVDEALPQAAEALPQAAEALPRAAADTGLPTLVEGANTETAEELVASLGRGTDLLNDIDTSDIVSIDGGTKEQEVPANMVQHPTFTQLPGSEALPVIS
ncbi:hypothetical protein GCM10009551_012330 [Nocardiopsis tropica]|uniref:hypothetical protein n=1 Tax=Nocardiopsis tropica TaxID=109330 RepID=UPI0031DA71D9